jgi:ABC-2 type transport system ATP-binding protein
MVIINKGKSVVEGDVAELLTGSKMKVMLTTDDNDNTMSIISDNEPTVEMKKLNEEKISLQIERESIPKINNLLINNGIKVYSIEPIRSLEEYFIDKTK